MENKNSRKTKNEVEQKDKAVIGKRVITEIKKNGTK